MDNGNKNYTEMFVFEQLVVYQLAVELFKDLRRIRFKNSELDRIISRQLYRAGLSISLNIAEGSGKHSDKDKRNFYLIARGSLYECVAIINILQSDGSIDASSYKLMYRNSIRISKMLSSMIRKHEQNSQSI